MKYFVLLITVGVAVDYRQQIWIDARREEYLQVAVDVFDGTRVVGGRVLIIDCEDVFEVLGLNTVVVLVGTFPGMH